MLCRLIFLIHVISRGGWHELWNFNITPPFPPLSMYLKLERYIKRDYQAYSRAKNWDGPICLFFKHCPNFWKIDWKFNTIYIHLRNAATILPWYSLAKKVCLYCYCLVTQTLSPTSGYQTLKTKKPNHQKYKYKCIIECDLSILVHNNISSAYTQLYQKQGRDQTPETSAPRLCIYTRE